MSIECVVVHVDSADGGAAWTTVRVLRGRVDQGQRLTCAETGASYTIETMGFLNWKAMDEGQRSVLLSPVDVAAVSGLAVGMHLIGR
jgi:translation elongation factor EF-4